MSRFVLSRTGLLWRRARKYQKTEFEQIRIRLAIAALVLGYVIFAAITHGFGEPLVFQLFLITVSGSIIALGLFAHLLAFPGISLPRRVIAMLLDLTSLSFFMHYGSEIATPFFAVYLWVTMGYGFRYGLPYLLASATLGVIAFSLVIWLTDFWHENLLLSLGLLASLMVLPGYLMALIKKLTVAKAQAEQANAAKGQFLATMSHELRTPLNAIIGLSDVLRSTRLTGDQRQMIRSVGSAAGALLHLVNGLLDFARIEQGKVSTVSEAVDLHQLLASIESIILAQAKQKGLGLSISLSPYVPHCIIGDYQHLQEVLINLCANAVKFTEQGNVSVFLEKGDRQADGGDYLHFKVTDTGQGIPPDQQERIFESFTQTRETRKSAQGGAGLGLAICRQLVGLMGGEIGLDSIPGEGSVFHFTVPFKIAAASKTTGQTLFLPDQVFYVSGQKDDRLSGWFAEQGITPVAIPKSGTVVRTVIEKVSENGVRPVVVIDCRNPAMDISLIIDQFSQEQLLFDPVLIALSGPEDMKNSDPEVCGGVLATLLEDDTDQAYENVFRMAAVLVSEQEYDLTDRTQNPAHDRSLNILVAEDNRVNRMVAAKILEHLGHKVFLTENGEQALDALDNKQFDLVFMDVNMPGIDGLEATQLYRYSHPGEPHLPIVALTADATDEGKDRCIEAGMDDVIHKPVTTKLFFDVIETLAPMIERRGGAETDAEDETDNVATHPRFQNARAEILDSAKLNELRLLGEGSDFFEILMRDFAEDAQILFGELEQTVEQHDVPGFRDANHALRSAAANIGALRIFKLCDATGRMEREEIPVKGPEFIRDLKTELSLIAKEIGNLHHAEPLELDPTH